MDQELLQRIDLIEQMVLQARHTTQYWGWCFALWGTGQLVALGLSIVLPNPMLIWAIAMTACGIATGIMIRRKRAREEKESLAFRPLLAIWCGFGISISLLSFLGQPSGALTMRSFCAAFFVLMGFKVDLRVFARPQLLGFALALTAAAIVGKQVCSFAVAERGLNRLAIGLGMIPRGEVGLIVAGIGATLTLPNTSGVNEPVINSATFGAVVIMVIITTLVTPPLLKAALARKPKSKSGSSATK